MADPMLAGTSEPEVLTGDEGDDTIAGGGGADTLKGEGGDDVITQSASQPNAAAGSLLDGGDGNDTLIFDGSQAYTLNYVRMLGGAGADRIEVATKPGQVAGAVQVEGGLGADTITIGGNIQGGERGLGYIDGGEGNDFIEVLSASNGVGIWGNRLFQFRGGSGDDTIVLGGTQIAYSPSTAARLDGGSGFDTLVWNGSYNLTAGGHQNPAVGLYNGLYAQAIQLGNVERLDLASAGVSGLNLVFTAADVAAITVGSDFDQATLGLGLSGIGNTLFLDAGDNQLDLAGWTEIGFASLEGSDYRVFVNGASYLAVEVTSSESVTLADVQRTASLTSETSLTDASYGERDEPFAQPTSYDDVGHHGAIPDFGWGEPGYPVTPDWFHNTLSHPEWLL